MKDHRISLNRFCPCRRAECPIRGNCVLCVQNHLVHKRHIPQCFQKVLRDDIHALAEKVELTTQEARPDDAFWRDFDKEEFLKKSLKRHSKRLKKSNRQRSEDGGGLRSRREGGGRGEV